MTTKAQAFRAQQERAANPPRAKQPKRLRRDQVVDTSLPGVSATDRKAERGPNHNLLAGRRGGAALEDSATGRPSRKSTRKSSDRTKRTTNLQLQAVRELTAPSARAARSQAAAKPARRIMATTRSTTRATRTGRGANGR